MPREKGLLFNLTQIVSAVSARRSSCRIFPKRKKGPFGELFEAADNAEAFRYEHKNDYPPETGWNRVFRQFSVYMAKRPENDIAFTLETAYFGTPENPVDAKRLIEPGHCFAEALKKYIETEKKG